VTGLTPLDRFNRLSDEEAAGELLAVCHSRRWAKEVAAGRPYPDVAALQRAADDVWLGLSPEDWREAFAAHPRIGEAGGASAGWSRQEQAGVGGAGQDTQAAIARGNLAALTERLGNDPATELRVAAEEHRRITRLRIEKLMAR
jgi:2-oxo-4-hydroxy-4-carboxy--5-ureidoimidazoline (OHCU) decarboxylase